MYYNAFLFELAFIKEGFIINGLRSLCNVDVAIIASIRHMDIIVHIHSLRLFV